MAPDKWITLAAAVVGAVGTGLLYKGSFAFIQPGGFYLGGDTLAKVQARNAQLGKLQKSGLAFLMLSFVLQAVALFV